MCRMKLKAISTLVLTCLCLQAIPAQCADICFDSETANRLYIDLEFAKKDAGDKTDRLTLCNQDRSLLENKSALLEQKITGLQADKTVYLKESNKFQDLYVAADQARVKAISKAPSRLTWFGAGVAAALVAGIAAAFAVK